MTNRDRAFKAGILRFCKQAGYDSDDGEGLAQLLMMPAVKGARVVARMVLDRREQQVKEAGAFLVKLAQTGRIAIPQDMADTLSPDKHSRYDIVPTREEADRMNTERGHPSDILFDPRIGEDDTTMVGGAQQPAETTTPTGATDAEAGYEGAAPKPTYLEGFKQPTGTTAAGAAGAGDKLQANIRANRDFVRSVREEMQKKGPQLNEEMIRSMGLDPEDVERVSRSTKEIANLKQFLSASRFGYRPGQMINFSGNSRLSKSIRGILGRREALAHELGVGPRQGAGHYGTGMRSGVYAPRAARGRQGRGGIVASPGPVQTGPTMGEASRARIPTLQSQNAQWSASAPGATTTTGSWGQPPAAPAPAPAPTTGIQDTGEAVQTPTERAPVKPPPPIAQVQEEQGAGAL